MAARTIDVRGHRIRTATQRRYVVVAVRTADVNVSLAHAPGRVETYYAFASIIRRSDSLSTARTAARRYGRVVGSFAVVVDLTTGEEV